ncbi:MAG: YggS family pyridoxal phosphate-dependent enzyme [Bryobacteraceae bacterium]
MPLAIPDFPQRLELLEARVSNALVRAGRARADVTVVAVSKKFSASAIQQAYLAGLRHFGENYVQEFAVKQPALADLPEARFHFIGHLQANKSRQAAELFQVIHTVDSPRLLQRLDAAAHEAGKALDILLEIKLSGEESKSGTDASSIPRILAAADSCHSVRVTGLMTMPPWSEDAETSRPYFQRLAALARQYKLPQLSMGMSNDFEVAIEEGATLVRVGTALFGPRPKPSPATLIAS